jgi:fermentation-respiration switch protein FrsA (DUF1100 family)
MHHGSNGKGLPSLVAGRWRSTLKWISSVAALVLLSIVLLAFAEVNNVLHPPRIVPPGNTLRKHNIDYQPVQLTTEDGVRLSAWYTPPEKGAVILLAHGYGDNRPEWVHVMLAKKGYGVLSWDARAHGESGGELSTIGYLEVLDVKAALEFALLQQGVEHIGAWGGSMGGATLIRAAARYPEIEALFVDSSFASLEEELRFLAPYPFVDTLTNFIVSAQTDMDLRQVNPVEEIGSISPRPVYIVHSQADRVAPPDAGERLYNAAREPRFLWLEQEAAHLAIYLDNPGRYQRRLVGFFDEWLLSQ